MSSINKPVSLRRIVPSVPVLSLATFQHVDGEHLPALTDAADVRLVTSGRIAIGLALRALDVGAGDVVLVPAYHSPSMIPPVHWRGAEVGFYRVNADTTPDLGDIAAKLDGRVKAIMVTHFFGFPQDLAPLRTLSDRHGIGLIEDCAHCFFGQRDGVAVGSTGDYAIGSSMKFFPIYEGGCLVSHRHALNVRLRGAGAGFEAKAALGALETAFVYGRLGGLRAMLALPLRLKSMLWNAFKARASGATDRTAPALAPASSDSSFAFDARWVDKRSSVFSRMVMRLSSRTRIVERRRRHYLELQHVLDGLPGCRPLFDTLPEGACPWIFPLLVEQAERAADLLQDASVPIVRFGAVLWPGVDASVCANSVALGCRLIGFPCHQELDEDEWQRMHSAVRQALEAAAAVPA